ncbi:MAG TPA: hypothetical protein VLL52_08175 [Anaerolineae bacterium]|nr:hypothetical protein [Anaerolineae bacterium]
MAILFMGILALIVLVFVGVVVVLEQLAVYAVHKRWPGMVSAMVAVSSALVPILVAGLLWPTVFSSLADRHGTDLTAQYAPVAAVIWGIPAVISTLCALWFVGQAMWILIRRFLWS